MKDFDIIMKAIIFANKSYHPQNPEFDILVQGYSEGLKEGLRNSTEFQEVPEHEPEKDTRNIHELNLTGRTKKALQRYFLKYMPDRPMQVQYFGNISISKLADMEWTGQTVVNEFASYLNLHKITLCA